MRHFINIAESATPTSPESLISDFMAAAKRYQTFVVNTDLIRTAIKDARAAVSAARAEAARSEDPEPDVETVRYILLDAIEKVFKDAAYCDDKYKLDQFYQRKPDVEASDELSFLKAEAALAGVMTCADPMSEHFHLFLAALRRFYEYLPETMTNHSLEEELEAALGQRLPLIRFYYRVKDGRENIDALLR